MIIAAVVLAVDAGPKIAGNNQHLTGLSLRDGPTITEILIFAQLSCWLYASVNFRKW